MIGLQPAIIVIIIITYGLPQVREDYPLDLSISLSGGKETN
jgi:hypothetical protein